MLIYALKEDGTLKTAQELRNDYINQVLWVNDNDVEKTAALLKVKYREVWRAAEIEEEIKRKNIFK